MRHLQYPRVGLAILGLTLAASGPCPGQGQEKELVITAEDLPLHPGGTWEFRGQRRGESGFKQVTVAVGGPERVGGKDYLACRVSIDGNPLLIRYCRRETGAVIAYSSPERKVNPSAPLKFPLRQASQWRDDAQSVRDGKVVSDRSRYRVLRTETVEVPAGVFRCLLLRQEPLDRDWILDAWIAPGTGLVKLEWRKKAETAPEFTAALVEFRTELPGAAAVRALVEKINRFWRGEGGVELLQQVLSDEAFAFAMPRPGRPSEAAIFDKYGFCEAIDWRMRHDRPQSHEHRIKGITVAGPLAYEIGESIEVRADGQPRSEEIMNVFARGPAGWRLIFSTPRAHVSKALGSAREDFATVFKLAQAYVGFFRAEDPTPPEQLDRMLAEKVLSLTSNGKLLEGKRAVLGAYRKSMEEVRKQFANWTVDFEVRSVRVLADAAVVFGKIAMTGRLKETDKPYRREVWETLLFERSPAGWRIIQEHSSLASSPASAGK